MAMARIWTAMVALSIICGIATGQIEQVSKAAMDGAAAAIELCFSMAGVLCLWSGISEIMARSGLSTILRKLLNPPLKRLFPSVAKDEAIMQAVSENVTANILGLGNAATPAGIKAATLMGKNLINGKASNDLCMFVILNTASLQILPVTIASLRAAYGAVSPFDILPAVWLTSAVSLTVGILSAKIIAHFGKEMIL